MVWGHKKYHLSLSLNKFKAHNFNGIKNYNFSSNALKNEVLLTPRNIKIHFALLKYIEIKNNDREWKIFVFVFFCLVWPSLSRNLRRNNRENEIEVSSCWQALTEWHKKKKNHILNCSDKMISGSAKKEFCKQVHDTERHNRSCRWIQIKHTDEI